MATIAELITKAETSAASNAAVAQATATLKGLDAAITALGAVKVASVKLTPHRVLGLAVPSSSVGRAEYVATLKTARVVAQAALKAALESAGVSTA